VETGKARMTVATQHRELPAEIISAAFARALAAAEAYRGATSPNPPVGCVVLDAQGWELAVAAHQRAGEAHAEAKALSICAATGTLERAHTLLVTLEPCNHTGRTPPCCDAILASPVRDVWIGSPDPNPAVRGGGARRLREAGLSVRWMAEREPGLAAAAAGLLAPFAKRVRHGVPWVTVKQALDEAGSMIPPAGRKTFTSPSSLRLAHQLRKRADAILTGSGTVLADMPEFTVRHVEDHAGKVRDLFILDRRRRVPPAYLSLAQRRGFRPQVVASVDDALTAAAANGALEMLVEAGPAVTAHVLSTGLWDEHIIIRKNAGGPATDSVERRLRAKPPQPALESA
jgi:diaminohydroxyphosphoribosylaminopyrimidine deaminase/5-amino-6-(5-phosphoribosylamino)uracil reductase